LSIRKLHPIFSFLLGGILPYLLTHSWKFTLKNKGYVIGKGGKIAVVDTTQGALSGRFMAQTGDFPAIRAMIPPS